MSTAILGGGLSGLSAAYYLLQKFRIPITIYESSIRLGGWIRTEHLRDRTTNQPYRFETGPRTIRPKGVAGANTLHMLENLKLSVQGIRSKHAAAKNRLIYAQGRLCLLPNSLFGLFRTLPPFTKPLLNYILNDLSAKSMKAKHNDESIYDFVARRFGKELATYAISPMICGICAGNAKEISVRFLMNELFDKEQRYGSVLKGIVYSNFSKKDKPSPKEQIQALFGEDIPKLYINATKQQWSMYSFEGGMEVLPQTLATYLKSNNVKINLASECIKLSLSEGKDANISFKNAKTATAKHVISALPSYKLAQCVRDAHPSLADELQNIPYVDVAVVNLQYNSDNLLEQPGFGFLVPPVEKLPILGVIYDSCCFDMAGNTVLTVMMGGYWFKEHFGKDPTKKQLLDTALLYVRKILNINHDPEKSRVHILEKCIPQYTVGHTQRVENIRRYIKNYNLPLTVCGAAYDGVGINDVILSARNQVENLTLDRLQ